VKGRRVRRRWTSRARELPALIFAVVWLLGYEVIPCAHLAMHAQLGAHVHGVTHTHCHGASCHGGAVAGKPDRPTDSRSHGAGSLEHRGVAALVQDLAIHVPPMVVVGEIGLPRALVDRTVVLATTSPPARGPPV
jgi:hypothetical protein